MTTIPATISERVPLPSAAVAASEGAGFTPADLFRIIRGRIVMITLLFGFFSAVAMGLFVLVYIKFPTYRATAIIECISNAPKEGLTIANPQLQKDAHERFLQSQALYVTQPDLLQQVLRAPEVKMTAWYRSVEKDRRLSELEDGIRCSPIRDSNYIQISMGTHSQNDPHVIVEKVVDTYLQQVKERATAQYRDEQAEYEREEAEIKRRIQEQISLIKTFRESLPPGAHMPGDQARTTVTEEKLIRAEAEVTELELQTLELEGIQSIYEDPQGPGVTPEDRQMVELNPQVVQLQNQVTVIEQELMARGRRFGSAHREIEDLQARLVESERQLAQMRELKLEQGLELKREQVRTAYLNSQHALLLTQERLMGVQAQQADIERKQAEFQRMQDELAFLKDTQVKVADHLRDLKRVVAEQMAIQIAVLQRPTKPVARSQPQLYYAPAGIFVALLFAVGLAVMLDLLDTSVRTPRDVIRHLNVPILGTIPDADDEEMDIECIEKAVREIPHSMVAEAFRAIRTNLQFSAPVERMRTMLITSPKPEDGKTAVACNLAAALANGGRRVLLIDANFRRPAIHNFFNGVSPVGLSNILVASAKLADCITKTELGNLDVLGSGPTPPNPAERLGSQFMRDLLEEAVRQYDQVIIDAPPVLLASDASALATAVDGAILVLRARENTRGIAQRAISLLNHVGAHLFGVVLNAAQIRRGGYFREQLRTFYDYHSDEALAGDPGQALPSGQEERSPGIDTDNGESPSPPNNNDDPKNT